MAATSSTNTLKNAMLRPEITVYTKVLEDLEKYMVTIMKSTMRKRKGVLGIRPPGRVLETGGLALVRVLSLVVRGMDV